MDIYLFKNLIVYQYFHNSAVRGNDFNKLQDVYKGKPLKIQENKINVG